LFSPFLKWTIAVPFRFANASIAFTYASPSLPNAAEEGMGYPFCQRRKMQTCPTDCSFGTYACRKIRSIERTLSVT
jgi:hypothetical protein